MRRDITRQTHLCFNCLKAHFPRDYSSKYNCRICQCRHHSLLHIINNNCSTPSISDTAVHVANARNSDIILHTFTACHSQFTRSFTLLTARIILKSTNSRTIIVRALLEDLKLVLLWNRLYKCYVHIADEYLYPCQVLVDKLLITLLLAYLY